MGAMSWSSLPNSADAAVCMKTDHSMLRRQVLKLATALRHGLRDFSLTLPSIDMIDTFRANGELSPE